MKTEDIQSILDDHFGNCGCSETKLLVNDLILLLENQAEEIETRVKYDKLFTSKTLFYVLAGILSDLNFIEHGTSIRCSWITKKGKEFLAQLKSYKNT